MLMRDFDIAITGTRGTLTMFPDICEFDYFNFFKMTDWDEEDSLTSINTALNKSMVLMDRTMPCENRTKGTRIIKINTKTQPTHSPVAAADTSRRSILKKPKIHNVSDARDGPTVATGDISMVRSTELISNLAPRPHNLDDFGKEDTVIAGPTRSTFDLDDLSDNEELWVMDISKTVNPTKLRGQTVSFRKKSKLKIGDERYCAVPRDNGNCLTWVFGTGINDKPYKAVNMKPTGTITVRRKLSVVSTPTAESSNCNPVSFPTNLKVRHPFSGSATVSQLRE